MPEMHEATLAVAQALLDEERDAFHRRAVSSAYYALFQRLNALVASCLSRETPASPDYHQAYRILDHRKCRNTLAKSATFQAAIGVPFGELQDARHWADYSVASHPDKARAADQQSLSQAEAYSYYRKALSAITFIDSLDLGQQIRLMLTIVADRS